MLISGSIYLLKSYINSVTHAKSFIDEIPFTPTENTRFIYSKKGQKLYAEFIFEKNSNYVAVLYIGYGLNPVLSDKLKSYYIQNKFNVVLICANGFGISGKNKKTDDCVLAEDLENWILIIKDTFGKNSKIILHGFSYTALATLNCAKYCTGVAVDNTYLSTVYNYKDLTSKILKHMYKNKSRGELPGINVPVFFSSENKLSKETYKLYEISASKKYVYIYDLLNPDEYINKLNKFIKHIKPPEE